MKFYVGGRSTNYLEVVQAVRDIKARGHEISYEWTALPMAKPYADNQERAAVYAKDTIEGVVGADIYIVFTHKDGNGVFTEFGAALAAYALKGSPRLYAIGDESKDASLFNYHPAIMWRSSVEEILDELGDMA